MRVAWATTATGDLQFIVYAESPEERLVLRVFREQQQRDRTRLHLHGLTCSHGDGGGPSSFNFGTITESESAP